MDQPASPHLVVVSNRGPFTLGVGGGQTVARRGAGGLVTAISSVARQFPITWISCALGKGDRDWLAAVGDEVQTVEEMQVRLVAPDPAHYHAYYNVISNPFLWFVQHQLYDLARSPIIDGTVWRAWEQGYAGINRQLAVATAEVIARLDGPVVVMPQDYHLYLFPRFLRQLIGDRATIQSFLHIPWPGPDTWRVLPLRMRQDLLDAMLQADRLGFQTERDTRRFLQTCTDVLSDIRVVGPWRQIVYGGRRVEAAPYPISVDVDELRRVLASNEGQEQLSAIRTIVRDRKLILRVDRVEPSKNVLRGFIAYRNFLNAYPQYRGKVVLLALLVPSRSEVREYKEYLRDIMAHIGEINATLGTSEWEPIRVILGNNYPRALAALSLYDVLLVNPLADGMNLVAKEGAVLNERDGVLILSEEAGAAEELGAASLTVSPFDVFGTREAIAQALAMPPAERHERATRLATQVAENDVHDWFGRQLADVLPRRGILASVSGSPL
jgi:trehalose 6-phosphate synthase